jgi:hypothetical protein
VTRVSPASEQTSTVLCVDQILTKTWPQSRLTPYRETRSDKHWPLARQQKEWNHCGAREQMQEADVYTVTSDDLIIRDIQNL